MVEGLYKLFQFMQQSIKRPSTLSYAVVGVLRTVNESIFLITEQASFSWETMLWFSIYVLFPGVSLMESIINDSRSMNDVHCITSKFKIAIMYVMNHQSDLLNSNVLVTECHRRSVHLEEVDGGILKNLELL